MTLAPLRPAVLDNPTNQELLAIYMKLSAKRLSDTSPSHLDLFGKYIPAMAHGSPALMEGILALAALQTGLMKKDPRIMTVDAASHYQRSLKEHFKAVSDPKFRTKGTDSMLATSIILSHYEVLFHSLLIFWEFADFYQDMEWRKREDGCPHVGRKGYNTG